MQTCSAIAQCPSCKKEHRYKEVVSCNSGTPRQLLQFYFNLYVTTCECGTEFDMSKNRIRLEIPGWINEVIINSEELTFNKEITIEIKKAFKKK